MLEAFFSIWGKFFREKSQLYFRGNFFSQGKSLIFILKIYEGAFFFKSKGDFFVGSKTSNFFLTLSKKN